MIREKINMNLEKRIENLENKITEQNNKKYLLDFHSQYISQYNSAHIVFSATLITVSWAILWFTNMPWYIQWIFISVIIFLSLWNHASFALMKETLREIQCIVSEVNFEKSNQSDIDLYRTFSRWTLIWEIMFVSWFIAVFIDNITK